jgi:NDP-sugar pyrophosphorylase family protein
MKALLLAAGEGTRLRPLTEKLPKPMIPIAGKPILEYNVEWLAQHGIREIAINLHHCPQAVMNHFGDGSRFGVSITYSYEPELLGTAGAVKKLESFLQGTPSTSSGQAFLVVYGDNLIDCDLKRLLSFHHERGGLVTIVLHYRDDVSNSGVVAVETQDRVTSFVEKPKAQKVFSHWVNAGILVLEPEVVKYIPSGIPSDFGKEILPQLLEQGAELYGYRITDSERIWWIDTPGDLERVEMIFKEVTSR